MFVGLCVHCPFSTVDASLEQESKKVFAEGCLPNEKTSLGFARSFSHLPVFACMTHFAIQPPSTSHDEKRIDKTGKREKTRPRQAFH